MARPDPASFDEKIRRVAVAVSAARGDDRRHFDFTRVVAPGVRLVLSEAGDLPLAFSLWTLPEDIAELCGDAAVPATQGLLAINGDQAREANEAGFTVDLTQLTRSQSRPDTYYVLLDRVTEQRVHTVVHRLVPALKAHRIAA
jgi:hypothetical protein